MPARLKAVIGVRGGLAKLRFDVAAARPASTQRRVLMRIISKNEDTEFGREHGFSSIRTDDDFRRRVPIQEYEGFRPYVNRIMGGEKKILTVEDPHMLTLSSGTTGEPKYIPVTPEGLKEGIGLMLQWLYRNFRDHPGFFDHACLSIVSQAIEGYTPSGIPFGSASGMIYHGMPTAVRRGYAIPHIVSNIRNYERRYFVTARLGLGKRVSYIATANPSSLVRLAEIIETEQEKLIRAICDGVLGVDLDDQPEIAAQLSARLKPNRVQARYLSNLAQKSGGLKPRECWPDLKVLACWLGGTVGTQARKLAALYGDVPIRDLGYLASEGHFTVPVDDWTPSGVVTVGSNYYEFIPEEQLGTAQQTVLSIHELETGERYGVIITTSSGLYRYEINDIVEVTGHYRKTPLLAFIRKGDDMTSITGEKMHANHVLLALEKVRGLYDFSVVDQFRVVPNYEDGRYELYVELNEDVPRELLCAKVIPAIDQALCEVNVEYAQKRSSKRLRMPRLHLMRRGWAEANVKKAVAGGKREAQYKWQLLCPEPRAEDRAAIARTIEPMEEDS